MPTYAIGDVQGCFEPLQRLLAAVGFDGARDRLWFCGDLVNRGPDSLAVLRFVRDLGERAVTVLGNHDLHLLAVALVGQAHKAGDTLQAVLDAEDRPALMDWLRSRPVIHHEHGYTMVHAGLPPEWSIAAALAAGRELEEVLRGAGHGDFLRAMYGTKPRRWSPALVGMDRWRFITNALTRVRYVTLDGALEFKEKRPPCEVDDLVPWYAAHGRASAGEAIVFGHWATLQTSAPLDPDHGVHHLDTGCVWGGPLSCMRLEDERYFSVPAQP